MKPIKEIHFHKFFVNLTKYAIANIASFDALFNWSSNLSCFNAKLAIHD